MSVRLRRVQRVFVTLFVVGVLISGWALFSAAAQLRSTRGDNARVEAELLGVTFISVSRSGRQVKLRPHLGIPLVLVGLPALGAIVRHLTLRRHEGD